MAEPLKDVYNRKFITNLSDEFGIVHKSFNPDLFARKVFSAGWKQLELKARMQKSYSQGFELMLFPDYVELYGQEHFEISVAALEQLTPLVSAEFAFRPFILRQPKKMMKVMYLWTKNSNEHVRRLASEGCRPRLPWAMALQYY